ncbi:hypothetical protein ACFL57_04215 [Candidatus Margulisiibacteriota bacterium]
MYKKVINLPIKQLKTGKTTTAYVEIGPKMLHYCHNVNVYRISAGGRRQLFKSSDYKQNEKEVDSLIEKLTKSEIDKMPGERMYVTLAGYNRILADKQDEHYKNVINNIRVQIQKGNIDRLRILLPGVINMFLNARRTALVKALITAVIKETTSGPVSEKMKKDNVKGYSQVTRDQFLKNYQGSDIYIMIDGRAVVLCSKKKSIELLKENIQESGINDGLNLYIKNEDAKK